MNKKNKTNFLDEQDKLHCSEEVILEQTVLLLRTIMAFTLNR